MATGLSSAITYEFKVAAISTAGMGMYSLPSEPITTVKNPALRPRNKNLRHPKKKDRSGLETMRTELAAVATPVELAMLREDVEGTLRGVGGFASAENGSSTEKTPRFEGEWAVAISSHTLHAPHDLQILPQMDKPTFALP